MDVEKPVSIIMNIIEFLFGQTNQFWSENAKKTNNNLCEMSLITVCLRTIFFIEHLICENQIIANLKSHSRQINLN